MLFWDIETNTLKKSFKVGDITITQSGTYVLCYSLKSESELQPAHTQSLCVQYGSLDTDSKGIPKLYIFDSDCIASTISAVPYKVSDNSFNANEWIFLHTKAEWYEIFMNHMMEKLEKYKEKTRKANLTKKQKTN